MNSPFSFYRILLFTTVFFLVHSCSKNDDVITYDLTGSWKVVSFLEDNKKITKSEDNTWLDINNGDITINFEEPDDNGVGVFSGINVTNGFSGNYTLKEDGIITIGSISTTFINEPEWSKLFKISNVENYEIRNSQLIIYRNNKKSNITLVRN